MRKRKILVIAVGIWPPAVKMAGTAAIYHLLRRLAKEDKFGIHVLTALPSWSDPNIDQWAKRQKTEYNLIFHFVRADNLLLTRVLFFVKALCLNAKHRFDLIHDYSSSPLLVGLTGVLGKICRCKTLHTLCAVNEGVLGSAKLAFGFGWVNGVICTSQRFKGDNKAIYLPFGIDVEKFKPQPKNFQKTILFLGSLEERKGAPVLMRAAKKVVEEHPDAKFIFASYGKEGRDPGYPLNRRKLEELSLGFEKNVEFLEGLQDVPQLMANVDIFVLPTTSLHGTLAPPITLIEAMSAGKPCVVSDVCRGDGLVEDGVNCLLFRSGDSADLGDKIRLLLGDEALREKLGKNARQKVVERFDLDKAVGELSKLYKNVIIGVK